MKRLRKNGWAKPRRNPMTPAGGLLTILAFSCARGPGDTAPTEVSAQAEPDAPVPSTVDVEASSAHERTALASQERERPADRISAISSGRDITSICPPSECIEPREWTDSLGDAITGTWCSCSGDWRIVINDRDFQSCYQSECGSNERFALKPGDRPGEFTIKILSGSNVLKFMDPRPYSVRRTNSPMVRRRERLLFIAHI
jgi:hypothetical protein